MDDALVDLYNRSLITAAEAYARAAQKQQIRPHLNL
jgi:hypothetical protein